MIFSGDWEFDNLIMESYLEKMNIISGSDRNRMLYVNKKIGGSALYGTTWRSYMSPTMSRPPSDKYEGQHKTKLLVDSVLCAFGKYTGGLTVVNFGHDQYYAPCKLNPREKPIIFNGSKFEHHVEPFEGTRYSLVFFNNIKNIKKI